MRQALSDPTRPTGDDPGCFDDFKSSQKSSHSLKKKREWPNIDQGHLRLIAGATLAAFAAWLPTPDPM